MDQARAVAEKDGGVVAVSSSPSSSSLGEPVFITEWPVSDDRDEQERHASEHVPLKVERTTPLSRGRAKHSLPSPALPSTSPAHSATATTSSQSLASKRTRVCGIESEHGTHRLVQREPAEMPAPAEVALARWLRRRPGPTLSSSGFSSRSYLSHRSASTGVAHSDTAPPATHPVARLRIAAASPEGKAFLTECLGRVLEALEDEAEDAQRLHYLAATYCDWLGSTEQAVRHIRVACSERDGMGAPGPEVRWLRAKLERQREYEQAAIAALERPLPTCLDPQPVPRVPGHQLSLKAFFDNYASQGNPVIITGILPELLCSSPSLSASSSSPPSQSSLPSQSSASSCLPSTSTTFTSSNSSTPPSASPLKPWSLDHIASVAGSCSVTLKCRRQHSTEWAGLEDAATMTVRDYIEGLKTSLEGKKTDSGLGKADFEDYKHLYLFDWSLPLFCPALAKHVRVPKYFANNFLRRTPPGSMYRDSWPSLFVGAAGVRGGMHVDAFGSHFWMALFEGQKRWVFYPPANTGLLGPRLYQSMDPSFSYDPEDPHSLSTHPQAARARAQSCVLEAGEVLFVPAGSPHMVSNLTTTVAVSGNFIDASNFELAKRELSISSLKDPHAAALLATLEHADFNTTMDWEIGHTPVVPREDEP